MLSKRRRRNRFINRLSAIIMFSIIILMIDGCTIIDNVPFFNKETESHAYSEQEGDSTDESSVYVKTDPEPTVADILSGNVPADTTSFTEEESAEDDIVVEDAEEETNTDITTIEESAPTTNAPVSLHDIYALNGQDVSFLFYDSEASDIQWEYYDMSSQGFVPVTKVNTLIDEFGRNVTSASFTASQSTDNMAVRVSYVKNGTSETQIAFLKILQEPISSISLDDINVEPGTLKNVGDLPVFITFQSGATDVLSGVYGMYFLETEETEEETSISENGLPVSTKTITTRGTRYKTINEGENSFVLCYKAPGGNTIQYIGTTYATDTEVPEITSINVIDKNSLTADGAKEAVIMIVAKDNVTPYPALEYAVVPYGYAAPWDGWTKTPRVETSFYEDETKILYCRDSSGNISSKEVTLKIKSGASVSEEVEGITTEDTDEVSVSDRNEWKSDKKIIINNPVGEGYLYLYENESEGIHSGFISENEYLISTGGRWKIIIQSPEGEETERYIDIDKIDSINPVIKNIHEEGENEN